MLTRAKSPQQNRKRPRRRRVNRSHLFHCRVSRETAHTCFLPVPRENFRPLSSNKARASERESERADAYSSRRANRSGGIVAVNRSYLFVAVLPRPPLCLTVTKQSYCFSHTHPDASHVSRRVPRHRWSEARAGASAAPAQPKTGQYPPETRPT